MNITLRRPSDWISVMLRWRDYAAPRPLPTCGQGHLTALSRPVSLHDQVRVAQTSVTNPVGHGKPAAQASTSKRPHVNPSADPRSK